MEKAAEAPLEYGLPVRWPRRRRVQRFALRVLLAGAICLAVRAGAPRLWHAAEAAFYAHYSAAPDEVVYDDGPSQARLLLRQPDRYQSVGELSGDWTGRRPAPAGRVTHFPLCPERKVPGLFFCHLRKPPGGGPLIALVSVAYFECTAHGYCLSLGASAFPEGTDWQGDGPDSHGAGWQLRVVDGQRLRIYAGQVDAVDASHFTIGYDLGGVPGVIDGWLRDTSDTGIELRVRDGPAIIEWPHHPWETASWQGRKP